MTPLLVLTNCPDKSCAEDIANNLVERGLAACVNILPTCHSVYRWQAVIERAEEVPLLIKTSLERYPALEAAIQARHPYDIPEIIALPITQGFPAYLNWLAGATGETT